LRPKSAKAKGRKFQQWVRDMLLLYAPELQQDDVRSTSMGASGEDILLSPAARKVYPFSIECKNVEKLNIWKAIEQSEENSSGHTPMIAFKRNGVNPYVAIPFETFIKLCHGLDGRHNDRLLAEETKRSK